MKAQRPSSQSLSKTSSKLEIGNDVKELLNDYLPNKQVVLCDDKELCYFGHAPTLIEVSEKHSKKVALIWLVGQITDLMMFSNCKNIINDQQIKELARMINSRFYYLKLTEIMLFFYKFKCGEYGDFYGTVSPISIIRSLNAFRDERIGIYEEHRSQELEAKREKDMEGCISYSEWQEMKKHLSTKQCNNESKIKENRTAKL